jgi:hypothetical protein
MMNNDVSGTLGEGVVYADELPIQWQVLDQAPAVEILGRWDMANERVLKLVSVLEENTREPGEEHALAGHELARLDFKLDLVLDLLGHMLRHQQSLPDARAIRLHGAGVEWDCAGDEAPAMGQHLQVSIHLNPVLPQPMTLYGEVERAAAADGGTRVVVAFAGMSEAVQDLLEKLIFRHHRRSIAHTRPARRP